MGVAKTTFYGNEFVGIFAKANDKFVVVPKDMPEKFKRSVEALNVEVVAGSVDGSRLIGVYVAMNDNGIILPHIATDGEVNLFKKTGLNVYRSKSVLTSMGLCMAVNDKGGIVNEEFEREELKRFEDVLGIELVPYRIMDYKTVGTMCAVTNKGFVIHNDVPPEVLKEVEEILHVKGINGTVNMGSPFVGIGVIANSFGIVTGMFTSGIEVQRLMEGLDIEG